MTLRQGIGLAELIQGHQRHQTHHLLSGLEVCSKHRRQFTAGRMDDISLIILFSLGWLQWEIALIENGIFMSFLVHTTHRLIASKEVRKSLIPTVLARTGASNAQDQRGYRHIASSRKKSFCMLLTYTEIKEAQDTMDSVCNLLGCTTHDSKSRLYTLTSLRIN